MIRISSDNRAEARHKLQQFNQINIIPILLLKHPPIHISKFFLFCFPIFKYIKGFFPSGLAGECELKYMEYKQALFVLPCIISLNSCCLKQKLHFNRSLHGEIVKTQNETACTCPGPFNHCCFAARCELFLQQLVLFTKTKTY